MVSEPGISVHAPPDQMLVSEADEAVMKATRTKRRVHDIIKQVRGVGRGVSQWEELAIYATRGHQVQMFIKYQYIPPAFCHPVQAGRNCRSTHDAHAACSTYALDPPPSLLPRRQAASASAGMAGNHLPLYFADPSLPPFLIMATHIRPPQPQQPAWRQTVSAPCTSSSTAAPQRCSSTPSRAPPVACG